MRADRAALDAIDAGLARQETDFSRIYLTRNEGDQRRHIMQQDIDIARRWRERHSCNLRWWHQLK